MWRAAALMATVWVVACSGKSELNDRSKGDGSGGTTGGSTGGSASGSGGAAGSGGDAASSGSGGRAGGGAAGTAGNAGTYIPDRTDVPPEGDGRVTGSFEGPLGDGWDFCFTNRPGSTIVRDATEPIASDGSSYMSFDSALECVSPCQPEGDDAHFGFWLDAEVPANVRVHLYFDAINLTDEAPSGVLQVDALGLSCETTEPLASIALGELSLTRDWQTRCVTFTPTAPFQSFGLYVFGESFHMGLDTFRFGPPCHAP